MSTLYLFVGALFSPFIGVVSLLGSLFKYVPTKTTIVCFCFIISIIGIYWFPWGDAQSHFSYYYSDFIERYFDFSFISIFSSYWFYDWVIFQIASVTGNYVYGYMFWLFFPLAFGGLMPISELGKMMLVQVVLKTMYEIIILPITIRVVKYIKHVDDCDVYDEHISYNVLKIKEI